MAQPTGDDHAAGHLPVLPEQVAELLAMQPGQTMLDLTVGRGGHAARLLLELGGGRYVGLDTDPDNAAFARRRLEPLATEHGVELDVVHANFVEAQQVLAGLEVERVDGLLADLGFASNQMDDAGRGFTFQSDGPLDMRLDPTAGLPASELVNSLPERELADLIYGFGEERMSRRVARILVAERQRQPIETTGRLADLVRRAYGRAAQRSRMHPATRTFMALRIAVNGELEALDTLLETLPRLLRPGGRAAVISFHSLEDRRVKRRFLKLQQDGLAKRLTRKPLTADEPELAANPRSRSAKLRAVRWL